MVTKKGLSSPRKKRLLISDVYQRFLRDVEVTKPNTTLVSYRHRVGVLVRLLADVCQTQYLDEVETDHLRQCVQRLSAVDLSDTSSRRGRVPDNGSTYAIETIRGYVRVWKAFFGWCFQEGLIEKNPADSRFKLPKAEKKIKPAFTEEAIYRMLDVFDRSEPLGFRNYVILVLLLDTGMRLSELAGLKVQDVHEAYVKVYGKGRKEREIGIHPDTGKLLWKYTKQYRVPRDEAIAALFLTRSGRAVTGDTIRWLVACVKRETGLTDIKVSPHVFRHTFAKMYLGAGGDVFKLSREMGHSSVRVTEEYLKDFGSAEARKDHNFRSPIAQLNLRKQHNKRKK